MLIINFLTENKYSWFWVTKAAESHLHQADAVMCALNAAELQNETWNPPESQGTQLL